MKKYTRNSRKKVVKIKLTKNDKAFVEFVKSECKRTGIKCDLRPTRYVRSDGIACAGYFDEDNKALVVAMNRDNALGILVHEYCHLTQWEEGIKIWKQSDVSLREVFEWLKGKSVKNIRKHIAVARELELDNERRSVRMIKKWKLSVNVKEYTKGANAYVHFYNWLYITREWSRPSNAPYNNKRVLNTMSSKFNMKYTEMSHKVHEAFIAAEI